jgi:hypothetical protein
MENAKFLGLSVFPRGMHGPTLQTQLRHFMNRRWSPNADLAESSSYNVEDGADNEEI